MFSALVMICATSYDLCAVLGAKNAYPTFEKCEAKRELVVEDALAIFREFAPDVEYDISPTWCTTDVDGPVPNFTRT